jgi:hypothetical protein
MGGTSYETDQAAFDAIVGLIVATGSFDLDQVQHGAEDMILFPSSDQQPRAAIVEVSAEDAPLFDDETYLRTVSFKVVITARDEDPQGRSATLRILEANVRNAVDHQSLAGLTFPAMTLIGTAQWPKAEHPDQRIEMDGSFVYLMVS